MVALGKIVDVIGLRAQPPVLEGAQDPGHGDRGIDLDLDKTGGDVLAGDILCPRDFQTLEHGIDAVQVHRLIDMHEHLARLEISVWGVAHDLIAAILRATGRAVLFNRSSGACNWPTIRLGPIARLEHAKRAEDA